MKAQAQEDRTIIAINTRYPKELYDAVMRLARRHRRSFHAEVLWALQTMLSSANEQLIVSKRADEQEDWPVDPKQEIE